VTFLALIVLLQLLHLPNPTCNTSPRFFHTSSWNVPSSSCLPKPSDPLPSTSFLSTPTHPHTPLILSILSFLSMLPCFLDSCTHSLLTFHVVIYTACGRLSFSLILENCLLLAPRNPRNTT
jgi:hypothetical protein